MTSILKELMQFDNVKAIMHALNEEGNEARFVGGAVRDALLDRVIHDIDIATPLTPERVTELLMAAHIKVIPTGLKHGTVTAIIGSHQFEITTLRRDVACDGRHAEVEFTDNWEEDAARRDFTMNAINCSMDGTIHDYFNGRQDIKDGIIRFVGVPEQRIIEDALRVLRFFRFGACFHFTMEEEALAACERHAEDLRNLSGERIQAEMFKLLASSDPSDILTLMKNKNILQSLLPCDISTESMKHSIILEKELCAPTNHLRRLALIMRSCQNVSYAQIEALAAQWKLSNSQRSQLQQLVLPAISISASMPIAEQKKAIRLIGKESFSELVLLHWAENLNRSPENMAEQREIFCNMLLLGESWEAPIFPISGNDMLQLDIKEGKELGKWLKQAEIWWEESDYRLTKEQILDRIKEAAVT